MFTSLILRLYKIRIKFKNPSNTDSIFQFPVFFYTRGAFEKQQNSQTVIVELNLKITYKLNLTVVTICLCKYS